MLLIGEDPPSAALARFKEVCREVFPIKSENDLVSLEFVALVARAQPSNLLASELLGKRHTTTETEFAKALRTKARLGRFLA